MRTQYVVPIVFLVMPFLVHAYEASPPTVPLNATFNSSSTSTLVSNIHSNGHSMDGIKISWVGEYDLSQGSMIEVIASAEILESQIITGDRQEIVKYDLMASWVLLYDVYTTAFSLPKIKFRIFSFGRPRVFAPSSYLQGRKKYLINWYLSEFGSYAELVPLDYAFDSIIVALTFQGMGKSMADNIDTGSNSLELEIFFPGGDPVAERQVKIAGFFQNDLRQDLNDNYSLLMQAPLTPFNEGGESYFSYMLPPYHPIHKSNTAHTLLAVLMQTTP